MSTPALPDDIETLKRLLVERDARVEQLTRELAVTQHESQNLTLLIEKLKLQIARLKRMQFGRSSERLGEQLAQLELLVEDLEANQAQTATETPVSAPPPALAVEPRRAWPGHLPRQTVEH